MSPACAPDATSSATAAGNAVAIASAFPRDADGGRDRAVIHRALVAHAPVDVVVHAHLIAGPLADVVVAKATTARRDAAAVRVADQVVAAVEMAAARADPDHLRRLGAGWARGHAAAAAAAQEPVDGAVAPVLARGVVVALRLAASLREGVVADTVEGQNGQRRGGADQRAPDARERATACAALRDLPRAALEIPVKPLHALLP